MGLNRRTAVFDGDEEDRTEAFRQTIDLWLRQCACGLCGMDPGLEERFIRVDVSDPCENGLVEDRDLDRSGRPRETPEKLLTLDLMRFRTQSVQEPVLEIGAAGGDVDASEATGVDELHSDPITLDGSEHPHDVSMWGDASCSMGLQIDAAGHPKPDHHRGSTSESEDQLLSSPIQGLDSFADTEQRRVDSSTASAPQVANDVSPMDRDATHRRSGQRLGQVATDCFDFWELRHGR